MKHILLMVSFVASALFAHAELGADGYYRIKNKDTNRYIYVYDNRGAINWSSTTVDLYAIQLWLGDDRCISDPASVLYVEKHGKQYDIRTQGTGIYNMIDAYVNLYADPRNAGTYWAYGEKSGMIKYLCDGSSDAAREWSWLVGENQNQRNWYITPIDANTDNYFGVKPTVAAGGVNYGALYADFPFSFASAGMAAMYVKKIDAKRGLAVWEEVASGKVPAKTPVIIKCASSSPSGNRLNLGAQDAAAVSGNLLKGVFFNYDEHYAHVNQVAYKPETMRVLGKTADGSIGLVTSKIDFIDRNSFYLEVPADSPADFKLVTQAEYDHILANEKVEAESITLSAASLQLCIGEKSALAATVAPANTTDKTVVWTSSNPAVATVDTNGNVTAVAVGTAEITATCGSVSAVCTVTVLPIQAETVTLDITETELVIGGTVNLSATVLPENTTDKRVGWKSSNMAVAAVDTQGKVTALKVGTAVITATCGNASANCTVTVLPVKAQSVTLDVTSAEIYIFGTVQLTVEVLPANTTDKTVVWTSSDPAVATVADGRVKGHAVGTAVITATCGDVSASCTVTVLPILTESVVLDTTSAEMKIGDVLTITAAVFPEDATDKSVAWSTSDPAVATVVDGLITAIAEGTAVITASCGDMSATCAITVLPIMAESVDLDITTAEIEVDSVLAITAVVLPDDAKDKTVVWTTSDAAVAAVADGVVTAIAPGTAVITAACGDVTATCVVTVIPAHDGILDIEADAVAPADVYTLSGIRVRSAGSGLSGLAPGLYIVGSRKYLVR